jgi:hypothetical protein
MPRLSIVLETTFAAVSSAGVLASDGSSADSAGFSAVFATATRAESRSTSANGPSMTMTTTVSATRLARSNSATTSTRTRGYRSASIAAKGEAMAAGMKRTRPTSPTPAAPLS